MLRGLVGGIIWGAVLGAVLLVSASLLMPLPETAETGEGMVPEARGSTAPPMAAPPAAEAPPVGDIAADPAATPAAPPAAAIVEVPAGSEFTRIGEDTDPTAPPPDAAPGGATIAPSVAGLEAGAVVAPPTPDSAPAARPSIAADTDLALAAPETETTLPALPDVLAEGAPPVVAPAPQAPGTPESAPGPAANPPDPLPEVELLAEELEAAPDGQTEAESALVPDSGSGAASAVGANPSAQAPAGDAPTAAATGGDAGPAAPPGPDAVAETAPDAVPDTADPDQVAGVPAGQVQPPPVPGSIGQAPRGFGEMVPEIPTNRLPRIGAADPAAAPPPDEAVPDAEPPAALGALARHAAPFDGGGGRPLMSVVLIDDGRGLDTAVLGTFPFPVTFAIPAGREDAAALAATYRASGFEVVALAAPLPSGATASDLETAFAAYGAQVPPAVAVVEPAQGGFQRDRTLMAQAAAALADSGLGLLLPEGGLPTAEQVAGPMGVPMARVFRSLDAGSENAMTIRRYLDRAAFKAGQDGTVVVMGTTRPETVTALFAWALEGAAEAVALAPLSAVLRAQ